MSERRMTEEELATQIKVGENVGREMATRSLQFQEAIAARLGITLSDHRCLELVDRFSQEGPVTAGKLSELTGLTTGAITGVVDRLERAGYVRREKGAEDRRQVNIKQVPERAEAIDELFQPLHESFKELCAEHSVKELEIVWAFMRRSAEMYRQGTELLRGQEGLGDAAPQGFEELSAALGLTREGRFELTRGASNFTLGAMRNTLLYRARFEGPAPRVRAESGQVFLEYNHSALRMFSLRKHTLQVDLNDKIPWEMVFRGGASKVVANMQELRLKSFELRGGASQVTLQLPTPSGTVPVRITGGSSQLKLLRPKNTPMKVLVSGGVSNLSIDKLELGAVGGTTRWESPDYDAASDRYEVQITGGASHLSLLQE
ncbi:MAG: MarR family transcriptional regulator [Myxococcales bacterium]